LVDVEVARYLDDLTVHVDGTSEVAEALVILLRRLREDIEIGEKDRLIMRETGDPPLVEFATALQDLPASNELGRGRCRGSIKVTFVRNHRRNTLSVVTAPENRAGGRGECLLA
jgi:hypothetical protein